MPTRRCQICNQYKHVEEPGICCAACHEIELDLLMMTYAYIHCCGTDYVPGKLITENVEPIKGTSVSLPFIRSWVARQWLEKNDVEAVCVPKPIQDQLSAGGFAVTPEILKTLERLKENKSPYDLNLLEGLKEQADEEKNRNRMAYMSRTKKM